MSKVLESFDWTAPRKAKPRRKRTFAAKCKKLFDGRIHVVSGLDFKGSKFEWLESRIRNEAKVQNVTVFIVQVSDKELVVQKILPFWVKQGVGGFTKEDILQMQKEVNDEE